MLSIQNLTVEQTPSGEAVLRLPGRLDIHTAQAWIEDLDGLTLPSGCLTLRLDFSAVTVFDSAGALVVLQLSRKATQMGVSIRCDNASSQISGLLGLVRPQDVDASFAKDAKKHQSFLPKVGEATIGVAQDIRFLVTFVGDACLGLVSACLHPKKVRWGDTITYMVRAGVDAIPIVVLISFLIGLIMGFQAAIQLKQFGANIFVADLVGLAQVRELGPLMTAIIVAGRSGSAFAAEIGTMKVSEEVDALKTMGFDVTRFLVVPKVLALMLTMPTLALISDAVGIFGGLLVGISALDLTAVQYLRETTKAVGLFDVFSGYFKSIVFSFLVAGVGCLRGLQVKGGAEGVGIATTSSVVSGIFLIVLSDAVFTVLFSILW